MTAATSPWLWYVTRSTATVGLILLTLSVVLGIATHVRFAVPAWPRFASQEFHRNVSLMAMVFVALHITTTVADSYVNVPVWSAILPMTSPYRRLSVSLGAAAFDLLLVVLISSLLRNRISIDWWRGIHYLSYVSAPIAALHVFLLGTDVKKGSHWLLFVLAGCLAVAVAAGVVRVGRTMANRGHRTAPPRRGRAS
jgi:DMSO/TMAO reductase YedYZ heme-binding membrane subunit